MTGGRLVIEGACHGDNTTIGVNGEPAIGVVGEAVADDSSSIGIGAEGRDTHNTANRRIFSNSVNCSITVAQKDSIVVEVVDAEADSLLRCVAGGIGCHHREGVAGFCFEVGAAVDGNGTRGGVNREATGIPGSGLEAIGEPRFA